MQSRTTKLWQRLPTTIDQRVRFIAWLSLAGQVVIVATGGAVRLTASGLGCTTWPKCTTDSWVATPEYAMHGIIEFGNRLLTFVLAAIAVAAFLAVIRFRAQRPDLFWMTFWLGMSIPAQAILGGITVLTGLNPYLVGAHFLLSAILVVLGTVLVYRVYNGRSAGLGVDSLMVGLGWLVGLAAAVTIVIGILTTGAGPHAGHDGDAADAPVVRNGFDPINMQHLHSYPAYAMLGLSILLLIWLIAVRRGLTLRFASALIATTLLQVVVGIMQARLGLPEVLVGVHMVLACIVVSLVAAVILSFYNSCQVLPGPVPNDAVEEPATLRS
ncbi:COX15/CtaA family protein [Klugiella xanthotipulae]|uniref:Cytochrome c oxidase assembly protein subunit 15 n=1 Tax=Klugiella xanthotipulae TaxID=244735 RepID=A0A543HSU9_9MICO|nr:cytochrome c oxidase assembly protein subunit 15 [Klugiella xanthotipulae]